MPIRSGRRVMKGTIGVTAGVLLTAGLTMAPAGAAVTSNASVPSVSAKTAQPDTLGTCVTGANTSIQYEGWCKGSPPTAYRVIVYCTNGDAVYGVERNDGNDAESIGSCEVNGLASTLDEDWGYLLCSNDNGDGNYSSYINRHGDISWILLNWGNGSIQTGGTTLCDYDYNGEAAFNPEAAP